ncbi:hypothetical protein ANO11243_048970 [Dothideomycetidae sp. 11243]|nr:hypothetical protein ANO11243_048970 [fungal sp. No.11243]
MVAGLSKTQLGRLQMDREMGECLPKSIQRCREIQLEILRSKGGQHVQVVRSPAGIRTCFILPRNNKCHRLNPADVVQSFRDPLRPGAFEDTSKCPLPHPGHLHEQVSTTSQTVQHAHEILLAVDHLGTSLADNRFKMKWQGEARWTLETELHLHLVMIIVGIMRPSPAARTETTRMPTQRLLLGHQTRTHQMAEDIHQDLRCTQIRRVGVAE